MATHNYKIFSCFNRKFTVTEQGPPPDVEKAFSAFTGGASSMSADHLLRFLVEHQGEAECTLSDSQRIVEELRKLDPESEIDVHAFFQFLLNHSINSPIKSQVNSLYSSSFPQKVE